MAFSLVTFLTSVENLLVKNNTTGGTYFIGDGLFSKVLSFHKGANGMSEKSLFSNQYPAIFVELVRKEENFSNMGNTGKRNLTIEVDIVPITEYGAGIGETGTSAKELAHLQCIRLTDNIEYLLRNKTNLSQTAIGVSYSRITDTRYLDNTRDSFFNCNSRIRLEVDIKNTA